MTQSTVRMRQVMDVSAAVWAGLVAGLIFLVVEMFLATAVLDVSLLSPIYWSGAIIIGQHILLPPITFALIPFIVGLILHFAFSVIFGLLIAFVIHRGGLLMGIVGGGLLGLTLYGLNFYAFKELFPWFYVVRGIGMGVAHVIFGAVAGGIYEGLEVEEFEPVN